MLTVKNNTKAARTVFLLGLALVITTVFFWVIKGFVVALFVAAIQAGLLYPIYERVVHSFGGRRGLASFATVLLSMVLIITPLLIFLSILAGQAVEITQSAEQWVEINKQQPDLLEKQLESHAKLKKLLPYQDKITAKISHLAAKAGAMVVEGLAAAAKGTAEFLLMLFIMMVAMVYFLTDGRELLDTVLRFTPLTDEDKKELIGIFTSVTRATLKGTVVIGIVQGGLGGLAFWFAGIQGVVFWAALMAVSSVIPSVGTALVWVPMVGYLGLSGQIGAAVAVGLWCAIIVGSADNILRPLLVGKDTDMPDIIVILTTFGGIALFGVTGILLGPIIGALYITVWRLCGTALVHGETYDGKSLNQDQAGGS